MERQRKFRENHLEEIREYNVKYKIKNEEKLRRYKAKYHKEHYIEKPVTDKNMKGKSAIEKGKRYENFLLEFFRDTLDKNTYRTPGSGSGLQKNDLVIPKFNLEVEAKNKMKLSILADLRQVERQRTNYNDVVLIVRDPTKKEFERSFVFMELNAFVTLLSRSVDNIEIRAELPDNLKWKVKKMKDAAHEVFKELK